MRTLIHIGMARAASTFLQTRVLPRVKDFRYFGVEATQYSAEFQKLMYLDDTLYDAEEIRSNPEWVGEENKILSNELFAGQSLYLASGNRTRTAHRLRALYPDGEIVLILRNQVSLLESLYALAVYSGQTARPEEYIRFSSDSTVPLIPSFEAGEYADSYRYTPLVRLYRDLFEKVHVFYFEDFAAEPTEALRRWLSALDLTLDGDVDHFAKINRSLSAPQLKYIRKSNHFKPLLDSTTAGRKLFRHHLRLAEHGPIAGDKFHFPPALTARIQEEFRDDNRELMRMVPAPNHGSIRERYGL